MGLVRDLNQRRFRRGPLASSTGHDWLHALAGCCPSPVIGKAVFARFVGGATSNGLHVGATLWYFRDLRRARARKTGNNHAGALACTAFPLKRCIMGVKCLLAKNINE